jgi:serine O-acetyltransferase
VAKHAAVTILGAIDGGTWRGTLALMRSDLARTVQECTLGVPVSRLRYCAHLIIPSAFCAIIFRLAHLAHANGWWRTAAVLCLFNQRLCGVVLHPASHIGPGVYIPHPMGVTFCGKAGAKLTIYPGGYISPTAFPGWRRVLQSDWPRLGHNVRVGTYSAIIGNVTVGSDALINVQVVLKTDLADGSSVLVRPNWRLQRKSDDPETTPVEHASSEL